MGTFPLHRNMRPANTNAVGTVVVTLTAIEAGFICDLIGLRKSNLLDAIACGGGIIQYISTGIMMLCGGKLISILGFGLGHTMTPVFVAELVHRSCVVSAQPFWDVSVL
ncbi:hypothetical protein FSARC_12870 [Fusarium sarcochroum]|uniref:Major facilitator superfamily (MFS) profile domain-containing protein n=1 Tax=Fusarium sarcochroum TaxID=1208366 RepID=A0A8H4T5K8_9HYPO|nr:hypothetical protein FSARC_12870 [Fusarium sarcochroum]